MLATEFKYYRTNHSRLSEKYPGKYIVIKGKKVIGTYDSHSEAFNKTIQTEELGTFLIQRVMPGHRTSSTKRHRFSSPWCVAHAPKKYSSKALHE